MQTTMSACCASYVSVVISLMIFAASHHLLVESFAPIQVIGVARRPTALFYQEGTPAEQEIVFDISKSLHIDDSNHVSILNNTRSLPVLVDCYTDKCGPCKLIERSLQQALPEFISPPGEINSSPRLQFVKWDADSADDSKQFMSIIREHDMTFRKLPTLLLFIDGIPVTLKSGMMSAAAINRFLEEHLPDGDGKGEGPRPKIGPDGALGVSTRKMNR